MAAIDLADCTVTNRFIGGMGFAKIVTPDTADDGDTIDVSSLFTNGCFAIASSSTDTAALGTGEFSTTITLAGSTDNEARTIICMGD